MRNLWIHSLLRILTYQKLLISLIALKILPFNQYTATLRADGVEDTHESVKLSLPFDLGVDINTPGRTVLEAGLKAPLNTFIQLSEPLQLIIDVLDDKSPRFVKYMFAGEPWNPDLTDWALVIWANPFFETAENGVSAYRSGDDGDTWQDITAAADLSYGTITIPFTEIMQPALYKMSFDGLGETQIICLHVKEDLDPRAGDGDRDYGDRVVTAWKPPDPPPPDPPPPDPPPPTDPPPTEPKPKPKPKPDPDTTDSSSNSFSGSRPNHFQAREPDADEASSHEASRPTDQDSGSEQTHAAVRSSGVSSTPSEPFQEQSREIQSRIFYKEDVVEISGRQLAAMIEANPATVTFTRHDVQLVIPSGYLASLKLGGDDNFTVEIKHPSEDSVSLYLYINGQDVPHELSDPFILYIPIIKPTLSGDGINDINIVPLSYTSKTDTSHIFSEAIGPHESRIPLEYDDGNLILTIYHLGDYTFLSKKIAIEPNEGYIAPEAPKTQTENKTGIKIVLLCALGFAALGAGVYFLFLRKKNTGHGI